MSIDLEGGWCLKGGQIDAGSQKKAGLMKSTRNHSWTLGLSKAVAGREQETKGIKIKEKTH